MCTFFYKKLPAFNKKKLLGPTYKKPKPWKSAFIKKTQVLKLIETPDLFTFVPFLLC